ncbi:MAG: chloride channel protein, partial [Alphaproteobacteria bacterium]
GMGAVAAAVLGAPLSTILIVFELTGDYQLTTAVMVAVVVSSITAQGLAVPGYFTKQLENRGRALSGGFG